mgnify:CR=1 FL=1
MMEFIYPDLQRVVYGEDGAMFIPVCPLCRRFVRSDKTITFNGEEGPKKQPNATCRRCGRVEMPFEGYV